jgi:hypothetical protein
MKRHLIYLVLGMLFGIILIKSEVASWFRIQEMFRFQAFHMYGVIGSAIATGMLSIWIIRKWNANSSAGQALASRPNLSVRQAHFIGGLIFGFGWALTGACPGPIYALVGNGYPAMAVVLISAIFGAFVYGLVAQKLNPGKPIDGNQC